MTGYRFAAAGPTSEAAVMGTTRWSIRRQQQSGDPLVLRTETLHSLQDGDLARVVGGTRQTTMVR